jgi:hypothetical protein
LVHLAKGKKPEQSFCVGDQQTWCKCSLTKHQTCNSRAHFDLLWQFTSSNNGNLFADYSIKIRFEFVLRKLQATKNVCATIFCCVLPFDSFGLLKRKSNTTTRTDFFRSLWHTQVV